MDDFRCKYLGILTPDCNECSKLDITEEVQNRVMETDGIFLNHWCNEYRRRVTHNNPPNLKRRYHSPFIFPCKECYNDGFKHFRKDVK